MFYELIYILSRTVCLYFYRYVNVYIRYNKVDFGRSSEDLNFRNRKKLIIWNFRKCFVVKNRN